MAQDLERIYIAIITLSALQPKLAGSRQQIRPGLHSEADSCELGTCSSRSVVPTPSFGHSDRSSLQ